LRIASITTWEEDQELFTNGQYGLTTLLQGSGEYEIRPDEDNDKKLQDSGETLRPIRIRITPLFGRALEVAPPGSSQRLIATFCSAVTMVHEIGHAICHSNFDLIEPYDDHNPEYWVGDDTLQEYGVAMIGWLFGGRSVFKN